MSQSPSPAPTKKPAKTAPPAKKPARPAPPAPLSVGHSFAAMIAGLAMSCALAGFVFTNQRTDLVMAVSHENRILPLQSTNQPNISSEALLNWGKLAVSEIFTYNFNDIVPRLNASRRFFTDEGWDSFRFSFKENNILQNTRSQRRFVVTLPTGAATIVQEGEQDGQYTWTMQIATMNSVYTGATAYKRIITTLKVAKQPTRESDSGYPFGIIQIIQ